MSTLLRLSTSTVEPSATPSSAEARAPARWTCRQGWHDWLYLEPSDAQLEIARALISHGRGPLGLLDSGLALEQVADRVCRWCHRGEARFSSFIKGLHDARGLPHESGEKG